MDDRQRAGSRAAGPPSRRWLALLGLATLLGIRLRFDQIGLQIAADDEWHSLHAVRDSSLTWILTHFGICDHCVPLTALDWILAQTVGLSEMGMRALPLAAGCLSVPLLAWLLRAELGERASLLFAALLAIAPLEVFYSRIARPYPVVFLLSLVALLALRRWLRGGGRGWAASYAVCAALALWFHLVVLPFVLAPLAWSFLACRGHVRSRAAIAGLACVTLLAAALLVGPPLYGDLHSMEQRSLGGALGFPDGQVCFELVSGSFRLLLVFSFALALLLGALVLRHTGNLGTWFLVPSLAQVLLLAFARPSGIEEPIIFVRYLLPLHGLALVAVALGLERLDRLARDEFPRLPRELAAFGCCAALYAFGPLPWIQSRPNSWSNALVYQANYERTFPYAFARGVLKMEGVPPIYAELARDARPGEVLLEAPNYGASHLSAFPIYQRSHRLPFLVGFVTPAEVPLPLCEVRADDVRFRFRNALHVLQFDELHTRHVRFVLFHRRPPASLADALHVDLRYVEQSIRDYKQRFGPPRFEDAQLCVFDLAPDATR
ncbi:MAG: hypothetical protein IPJ19_14180 [Planctomycetes bacterium]|nr:hypothetical protein [Planctomycetota bacterium]